MLVEIKDFLVSFEGKDFKKGKTVQEHRLGILKFKVQDWIEVLNEAVEAEHISDRNYIYNVAILKLLSTCNFECSKFLSMDYDLPYFRTWNGIHTNEVTKITQLKPIGVLEIVNKRFESLVDYALSL